MKSMIGFFIIVVCLGFAGSDFTQSIEDKGDTANDAWEKHVQDMEKSWSNHVQDMENEWSNHIQDLEKGRSPKAGKSIKQVKREGRTKEMDSPKKMQHVVAPKPGFDEAILDEIPRVGPGDQGPDTGLIIDARGKGFRPVLVFQVRGERDRALYNPAGPNPYVTGQKGLFGCAGSLKEAMTNPRVGHRPIEIKATRVEASRPMCIWIDDKRLDHTMRERIKAVFENNAVVVVF